MTAEFWLPLRAPYEGYAVSTEGRVKSLGRWIDHVAYVTKGGVHRSAYSHWRAGVILQPHTMPCGHLQVVPGRDLGSQLVHRMVAFGFFGPCPAGLETRHMDGVPDNNRPENLRYGTRSENTRDDWAHGKMRSLWRIKPAQVRRIRWSHSRGTRVEDLARRYGVTYSAINNILKGRARKFD